MARAGGFNGQVLGSSNVIMIDTERESEIGIGTDWPYDPISP